MNGRTTALILFLWALLTVITPTLVRMSASVKLLDVNGLQMKSGLLPRRALKDTKFIESPAPAAGPEPGPESGLGPGPGSGLGPGPGPGPGVIWWRSKYGLCSVCICPENNGGPCWCCLQ